MYIKKNDLICRLVRITDKDKRPFSSKTVKELSSMLERYDVIGKRVYLDVPYKDKELVKFLGAKYDGNENKWNIPQGVKQELFSRWA